MTNQFPIFATFRTHKLEFVKVNVLQISTIAALEEGTLIILANGGGNLQVEESLDEVVEEINAVRDREESRA